MASKGYSPRPDGVDIVQIARNLKLACESQSDVTLPLYIAAFQELSKFFDLMGVLFATMANDIRDQIVILEKLRSSSDSAQYQSVKSVLDFESAEPTTRLEPKRKDPSGSRTVLHLDRTLEFFLQFLEKMITLQDEDPLAPSCQEAYKATLGKYHSWILSKAAGLAIKTLPTKLGLFEKVSKYNYEETVEGITAMVAEMRFTHSRTKELFSAKNLLTLPF